VPASVGRWGVDAERVVFAGFEGVQLVADVRGDPDGWPVLLLHGGGQTRHAWGGTAQQVADRGWFRHWMMKSAVNFRPSWKISLGQCPDMAGSLCGICRRR